MLPPERGEALASPLSVRTTFQSAQERRLDQYFANISAKEMWNFLRIIETGGKLHAHLAGRR